MRAGSEIGECGRRKYVGREQGRTDRWHGERKGRREGVRDLITKEGECSVAGSDHEQRLFLLSWTPRAATPKPFAVSKALWRRSVWEQGGLEEKQTRGMCEGCNSLVRCS
eukprot:3057955-Rhodomonas_salina.1